LESEALASYHSKDMERRIAEFLSKAGKANANTQPPDNSAETAAPSDIAYGDDVLSEWHQLNPGVVDKLLTDITSRPWTSEQVPLLAEWAKANQAPIDLLVEASRRPRYYAPSETLINNDRDMLVAMLLPMVQNTRDAGRALSVRAMWHAGEGRPMEAWQDILAIHRLSHLVAQGYTLVEQLVGLALSGIACDCTVTLLDHAELTAEQARQVQRDLAGLPNFAVMARALNTGERLMALDAFIRMGSGGGGEMFSGMTGGGNDFGNSAFDIVSVDWNLTLRDANRWYDRLVAAAQLSDREARVAALAKAEADMELLVTETRTATRLLAGVVSRQQRSQIISSIMLGLFLPALNAAIEAEDRQNTTLELTRLAVALAVYRAEHGSYPESIDQLVPAVLERLPVEVFSGKPFVYKRSADGFLLYGVGVNGVDEGGSNERYRVLNGQSIDDLDEAEAESQQSQIPTGADDNSILVPRPAFELPKIMAPTTEQP
jgi:type II secretory pathway pseudopilin PulG